MKPILWQDGEPARPLAIHRHRAWGREPYVGFLTGSDANGRGLTIFLRDVATLAKAEAWLARLSVDQRKAWVAAIVRRPDLAYADFD